MTHASLSLIVNLLFLLLSRGRLYAATNTLEHTPGVLESLEKLIDTNQDIYKKLLQKANTNILKYNDLKKVETKNLSIHPDFLNIIIFNSDEKYLSLIEGEQAECLLYSLMENRLLNVAGGIVTQVILRIRKNDKSIIGVAPLDDFLKYIQEKQCYAFKQISSVFEPEQYLQTLNQTKKPIPSSKTLCHKIMQDWKKNFHLPYFCKMIETMRIGDSLDQKIKGNPSANTQLNDQQNIILKEASSYKRNLSVLDKSYFKSVCENIDKPEKFCNIYLSENVWDQVIRGEKPDYLMKYKCRDVLNKETITAKDYPKCKEIMETTPEICTKAGMLQFPSLYPKPNCHEIARAYKNSHLNIDYQDCPGKVDFESVINISRKLSHLFPFFRHSTSASCEFETYQAFAETVMNEEDEDIVWPLQFCFKNLASSIEECLEFIPGHHPDHPKSEEKVLALILSKTKGASVSETCKKVNTEIYNPLLLEYKNGCYIVIDSKKCNGINCQPTIFYRGKQVTDIKYLSDISFEYFPINYLKEKYSVNNILKKNFPIIINRIYDLNILKNYFKEYPSGIIYGIGCVQDILPQFFKTKALNDCSPIPFIIDGYDKNQENILLSIRTSIDDLHSPRLIDWNFIFNAVSNFKELQPINTWTLYGFRKK
ncbi:MAG: hypothetical protein A2381_00340 [Bdellovibrionales bacterium RIFOXYB1_FULL_37_110]|nr:MAG: hypothetical protein A2417_11395 [Bdellovibrionales bacterium RIFOXYC1_FULL_37_79]OFZ60842.1 MAG: hypothetical protein A2381_00340 [Bdellovibrionales bacterium RIFOXYB1_FULL_37_110]OFZ62372.1 MAG: hypothetical protein A2577_03005 [Bdellovibrionales bacterium RIFOXYD1_FULL_36_51]